MLDLRNHPRRCAPAGNIKLAIPDLDEVTQAWAATAAGLWRPVFTRLVHPELWRIDEGRQR